MVVTAQAGTDSVATGEIGEVFESGGWRLTGGWMEAGRGGPGTVGHRWLIYRGRWLGANAWRVAGRGRVEIVEKRWLV